MEATAFLGNERRIRIQVLKPKGQDSELSLPCSIAHYLAGKGYKNGSRCALLLIVSGCGIHWDLVYSYHNWVREERCQKPSSPPKDGLGEQETQL